MHVQKVGCRWKDCPSRYGPHKTIYNRFARWSEQGNWQSIFAAVAASSDAPGQMALDSSRWQNPPLRQWRKRRGRRPKR